MAEEPRRIIHVKGIGKASQAPDQVTISLELEASDEEYSNAVAKIADKISALRTSVVEADFDTEDLKTENFYVQPIYDWQKLEDGNTQEVLKCYKAVHRLELTFDFDNEKFNKTIYILTNCLSNPEISAHFKIKDKTKIEEQLLKSATEDARRKAEILCAASGEKLGKLLSIGFMPEHSTRVVSATELNAMLSNVLTGASGPANMHARIFIPKDIEETEIIYFSWEILD